MCGRSCFCARRPRQGMGPPGDINALALLSAVCELHASEYHDNSGCRFFWFSAGRSQTKAVPPTLLPHPSSCRSIYLCSPFSNFVNSRGPSSYAQAHGLFLEVLVFWEGWRGCEGILPCNVCVQLMRLFRHLSHRRGRTRKFWRNSAACRRERGQGCADAGREFCCCRRAPPCAPCFSRAVGFGRDWS